MLIKIDTLSYLCVARIELDSGQLQGRPVALTGSAVMSPVGQLAPFARLTTHKLDLLMFSLGSREGRQLKAGAEMRQICLYDVGGGGFDGGGEPTGADTLPDDSQTGLRFIIKWTGNLISSWWGHFAVCSIRLVCYLDDDDDDYGGHHDSLETRRPFPCRQLDRRCHLASGSGRPPRPR